jgi:hypothetical protein
MSEEVLAESLPVPEQVATAVPEADVQTPEASTPKTYTQEEFDAMAAKQRALYERSIAKEQRKWERDQAQRQAETQTLRAPAVQSADQFETTEAYAEALALQKAEELVAKRDAAKHQSQVLESYHEKEEEARSKYDDFEQVAYNPKLTITGVMAETIQSSEIGPDIAYYLGANPKEADRISRLTLYMQAKEIGLVEAKLVNTPTIKKSTSAPAPISPITARTSGSPSYDTTDPRSTKTMSTSEWIEAERSRQMKKLQAQANR